MVIITVQGYWQVICSLAQPKCVVLLLKPTLSLTHKDFLYLPNIYLLQRLATAVYAKVDIISSYELYIRIILHKIQICANIYVIGS